MKEIKAKTTFSFNGEIYEKGDIVKVFNINDLVRLNERGFIEPLSAKDIQDFVKRKNKKERED